ncbi:histidine kinase N-terminal 7TM domain-containing diguanylate cyclase [Saccharibacillus kuerlensis]|uniref:GGDEF domain-containing protein n=1 Tax=Saccharibacillus kuerlensis TaxID=459527 RepID=A0ABQ2KX84_9BACL|nr:histidine kinase N-terminal 7TM domain-containing protein [Saccharibacillus kuerlensis]GGN94396.1 GGDEF domain-containing protein [Saccharibacillus kuerlensis]
MAHQLLVYVILILLGGALSLFLALYALIRFRSAPGGGYYILAALMVSILSFGYALELTSPDLEQIKFWIGIEYFALPFLPVFTLLMCLEYVGMSLGPWKRRALYVIPALTFVLQHTNELHHLYYTSIELQPGLGFLVVDLERGPWYTVHTIYLYGCLILSMALLLMRMRQVRNRFRLQILAMTAGLLIPVVGNLYYLAGLSPYGLDLGPVFISISFVFHSMALFRYQMFNVVPIARESVFESMGDGVLVLNEQNVLVDYNRAVLRFIPELTKRSIGRKVEAAMVPYPEIAKCIIAGNECDLKLDRADLEYAHVRFSPINGRSSRCSGRIVTFVDITDRILLEQELKRLASTDGLTGLFNKNALIEHSKQALQEQTQCGSGISVIMFDVDHFKRVNDTFGHEAGDRVLSEVADVIRRELDEKAIAGRYGGDEFVLCLPDTLPKEAWMLAERIRVGVERMKIVVEGREVRVTSSIGVSHTDALIHNETDCMQALMRYADKGLYRAKQLGRNRVNLYQNPAVLEPLEAQ